MKCIYRIQIRETNDGTSWYVPQVTYPYSKLAKIFGCKDTWLNIYQGFGESETMTISYITEEEAMEQINSHKLYMEGRHGKQTKSITYKQV
jgi:hypothetical protein